MTSTLIENLVCEQPSSHDKTFKVITLGCRTNQYESEAYQDQLSHLGYRKAQDHEVAKICIVNTCTVTESADKKSLYQIRQLSRENPGAKIVVTGCLTERKHSPLEEMQEITHLVKNKEKERLIEKLFPEYENLPEFKIEKFSAHTRAFVKVQDGCNSYCSYCVIPFVRGRSRSKDVDTILGEVRDLVSNGYKEVVITGINVGDFDGAPKEGESPCRLSDLINMIDEVEGLKRIRVSSIDPDEVDDALIEAIIHGEKTCKSMHIVLQAGSNAVLKRMNRKYTKQDFLAAIHKLLSACPDFTFTTDVIVGFPGETDQDFEETLEVIRQVKFAKVHMFPFSLRPGTKAERLPNHLDKETIGSRKQKVLRCAEEAAFELREAFVGKKLQVLLEDQDPLREGHLIGHTDQFLLVSIPERHYKKNDLIEVLCHSNTPDGLLGEGLC